MNETRDLLERVGERFTFPDDMFERLGRRRDRKRRNQRIAAGVVGIAVFVAAVWAVTSGLSLDRTETPAVPGPAETGPAETGPMETGPTAPPSAPASAGPDEVMQGTCSDGARSHLELTRVLRRSGLRIKVRFEVHRSPVGHSWLIRLRHHGPTIPVPPPWPNAFVFFRGTRVASDSGVLAVQGSFRDRYGFDGFAAYAVDKQTGQVCRAAGWIE